jgi:hypothetical protein
MLCLTATLGFIRAMVQGHRNTRPTQGHDEVDRVVRVGAIPPESMPACRARPVLLAANPPGRPYPQGDSIHRIALGRVDGFFWRPLIWRVFDGDALGSA